MNKTVVFDDNGAHVLKCKPFFYNKDKVIINPVVTPECPSLFWKKKGEKIIEMNRSEKLKALSATRSTNYWYLYLYHQPEIMMAIFTIVLICLFIKH